MKKRTLFTKLTSTLLCVGLLFFASCSDLLGFQEGASSARTGGNGKVIFNGSICVTGAMPAALSHAELDSASQSSASRSALPSITIGADYYYYVTATKTDGSEPFNINSIDDSGSFDRSNGVTFALELATGNWNIECGIKKAETSDEVSDDDLHVMSDTYPATLTSANPVVNHTFYPKPGQNGEGKVELKISVDSAIPDFGQVTASCSKSAWAEKVSEPSYDAEKGQWIIQTSNTLPSGTYEVTFNFYNTSNILLYSTVQTINVFDNMTTNTWLSDGSGVIDDEGTFALSVSLVSSFARTTFYVGQTSAATSVKVTADDITGTGSPYAPFATVTKAVEVIAATGDISKDYRIYVSGTVTGSQKISDAVNRKANSITIQGYNGLDSSGSPKDALSCSGSTDAVTLKVVSTVPVTLKNIKLLGDSTPASKTMVLVLENNYETDVTIEEGVWITGNDTSSFTEETFSAVYVGVDGKLTMKGGKISGNKCMSGGGIVVGGTFVMTGGEISGNEATAFGGGVYNVGSMFMYGSAVIGDSSKTSAATELNYSNKAGYGAGIYSLGNLYLGYSDADTETELTGGVFYNFSHDTGGIYQYANKTFLMNSGSVSYNAGRGIYVGYCSFTMSGGSVIGNTTFEPNDNNYQTNGAGIYAGVDSTVLISGGTISGNEAGEDGGGLYIAKSNTSVTIEGGTISGNSADGKGNGIAIADGYLKMKGNASVDSNNDVYLASGKVITVTGALTGTTPVATITPAAWTRGTTIVQADGTNVTDLTPYKNFFKLTQSDWIAKVSTNKIYIDTPIYVASKGTDSRRKVCAAADSFTGTATGSKSKPFATIEDALSVLNAESNMITIDGNVVGNQQILSSKVPSSVTSVAIAGYKESGAASSEAKLNGNGSGTVLTVNKSGLEVSIEDLEITGGNNSYGGGLAVDSGTAKLLDGAKITGNTATVKGGGVYLGPSTKLVMEGSSTISGNSAASGGAVYNAGTFNMSGNALVDSTNDVYLESGKTITITDSLTGTPPVATITPASYYVGTTVLAAGPDVNLADEVEKFRVTPDAENLDTPWRINSGGILMDRFGTKTATDGYAVGDIVFKDGSATPYTSGLTFTNEEKAAAIAVIYYAGSSGDVLGAKTLGVGLKSATGSGNTLAWCLEGAEAYDKDITAIQCTPSATLIGAVATATFTGDTDGSDNWQALCDAVSDEGISGNYPAWEWLNSYATANSITGTYASGWYIPTAAELCVLYRAVKAESSLINAALEALDGSQFNTATYLSSSQDSSVTYWRVAFNNYLDTLFRDADVSVCAVRAF
ncbi:MAG: hypothetical protein IJ530_12180 [Treponema sp.]|uniref:hypothetical protein n=1 Tax=Treponema sp. TaxID=166 RepID=UPI0025CC0071|nr:hypothetical protein [Treponema sp.]MBQ8680501.1 hypothetical protein [Treponema sp.]